ncbi:MAG TPA: lysophospholipid acyltransferase family protein [Solirubrobacterales bacterium]|nr:lysophospholipid acyltransferase family protein [Solirubrobacterales bacterium]
MKPQVYVDDRPAEYFDQFHASARQGVGWTYTAARILVTVPTILLYRVTARGRRHVPRRGAAVLAPNHFSQADHFFVGVYLWRKVRFMAKSQLFGPPVLTYILKVGGVFPVRRGNRDEKAFETAYELIEQGELLLVYAEGGRSRSGELGTAKPGIGRIALETGVPIIPTAIHGSAGVRGWKRLRFPRVTVEYGEPITFPVEREPSRERQQEVADQVFARVRELYEGIATRSAARSGRRSPDRAQA